MLGTLLFAATCLLAYANGANDNAKGVASLFGSDTARYRTAIVWATAATMLGSVASIFLAQGLIAAFSGKGLVPEEVASGQMFLFAVAGGAGGTVLLATVLGFPISTTHGLVGAIVGAGLVAAGPQQLQFGVLVSTFVVPLLLSPLLALAVTAVLYGLLHGARRALGVEKDACVCVGQPAFTRIAGSGAAVAATGAGAAALGGGGLELRVDREHRCVERYGGAVLGLRIQGLVDAAHYTSAGLVSFARGLNDTPKIAALLLVLRLTDVRLGTLVVGAAIAAGGLLSARRVGHTMGRRITAMNHGQGLAANLTTGLLVIWASRLGIPVSTTHVSAGSLFGIGLATRQGDPGVVREVALSWVLTLPLAAALAAAVYGLGTGLP